MFFQEASMNPTHEQRQKKMLWISACLIIFLGVSGCGSKSPDTKGTLGGSETEGITGGGGQGPTASKCETDPSLASNPLCQIVLTGFSGQLTAPNSGLSINGYFQNTLQLDGKINSTTWYASKTSTQPLMVTNFTYYNDGTIQSIDTTADSNADSNMDLKTSTANTYLNGKPATTTVTTFSLPSNTSLGKNQTTYSYNNIPSPPPVGFPNDTVVMEVKLTFEYTNATSPTLTTPNVMVYEYNFLNSDNHPVESRILRLENPWNGLVMVQKFESAETFQYNNGLLGYSEKNFYDCSKSNFKSCYDTAELGIISGLRPYVNFKTNWIYTDGKLSHGETLMDGDLLNPNGINAGINGTVDYKWQCDLTYDAANQKVIAKFPEVFRFVGLSETDKIQSLSCDDFQVGKMGGNFTFDEWSYLWQATSQPEPQ
jgi:hypothetical protein